MVNVEKVTISTKDGVQLEAEYYQNKNNLSDNVSAVLICHPHPQFN